MTSRVHRSAVFLILVTSSPYVSATSNWRLWPCRLKYTEFTSSMASVIAPEICSPGLAYSRSPGLRWDPVR